MRYSINAGSIVQGDSERDACRALAEQLAARAKGVGDTGLMTVGFAACVDGEVSKDVAEEPVVVSVEDHLFGFVAWLTSHILSTDDSPAMVHILEKYIAINGLGKVSAEYPDTFTMPIAEGKNGNTEANPAEK